MKINEEQFYTVKEITQLGKGGNFPYRSANMIFKLIHDGRLIAIRKGVSPKDPYVVKGENIIKFLENTEYFKEIYLSKKQSLDND